MIKKLFIALLCLCLLATLAACKEEPTPPADDSNTPKPEASTPEEESTLRYSYSVTAKEGTAITVEVHAGRVLYVKGAGSMPDDIFEDYDQPWYEHGGKSATDRSDAEAGTITVTTMIVEEGITAISDNAFRNFNKLETVALPSTLRSIGFRAFADCPNLRTVTGGSGITTIGASAFRDCTQLSTVHLSATLEEIEESAFSGIILPGVARTLNVTFKGSETEWQLLLANKAQSDNAALTDATVTYAP